MITFALEILPKKLFTLPRKVLLNIVTFILLVFISFRKKKEINSVCKQYPMIIQNNH